MYETLHSYFIFRKNGVYEIEILAEDTAGLTDSVSLVFTVNRKTIDKIPPQAVIDDVVLSEDGTTVLVTGSVTDETEKSEIKRDEDTTILVITGELEGSITEDGRVVYVKEVRIERLAESIKVYNLEVEGLHAYYVGSGILVHNEYGGKKNASDSNESGSSSD